MLGSDLSSGFDSLREPWLAGPLERRVLVDVKRHLAARSVKGGGRAVPSGVGQGPRRFNLQCGPYELASSFKACANVAFLREATRYLTDTRCSSV